MELLSIYALFRISTSKQHDIEEEAKQWCISSHPSVPFQSYFGVFVTLYRQPQTIPRNLVSRRTDPINNLSTRSIKQSAIHGCIGHWTDKALAPNDMIDLVQRLSRNARTTDDRRFNFTTDIDQDASATMEINFMNLPRNELKPAQYRGFDNNTHGIIVESIDGRRATYLPGVFPATGWDEIKHSLLIKAGISRDSEPKPRFYTYTTTTLTVPIYDLLFSPMSRAHMENDVADFFQTLYSKFVPYMFIAAKNAIIVRQSEAVRNVAVICNIIKLAQNRRALLEKPLVANLDYYYQLWFKDPDKYRQASIFLIKAYTLFQIHSTRVKAMGLNLYTALENGLLEPCFELGEAVSVLAQTPMAHVIQLQHAVNGMYDRTRFLIETGQVSLDMIFELNWHSQSVFHLAKIRYFPREPSRKLHQRYSEHAQLLLQLMMVIVPADTILDALDINYLAVMYECFSNLDALMCHLYLRVEPAPFHAQIRNQRLRYFAAASRMRASYGLYYFKGGNIARLDITGHILSVP